MKNLVLLAALAALVVGCKKKKPEEGVMPAGSGQAMGSGGAMGSAMGSGGAMGSGSAAMGSGSAAAPMTGDDIAKRFTQCWGFFNDNKWDDFKGCYASDVVYEMPGGSMPPSNGADATVEGAKGFKAAFPDAKGDTQLVLVNGHSLVGVSLITGTNSGEMKMGAMTMPATNKKIGLYIAQVLDLADGGQAKHVWEFIDLGTMMGQLKPDPKHPVRPVVDKLAMPMEVVVAKDDATEKANVEVAKKMMDAFDKHDAKALAEVVADDVVWSEQAAPKDMTKKELIPNAKAFWKAFSDAKLSVASQWAAGDYVATVGTLDATNTGDLPEMHLKKTGKHVSVPYLAIDKIADGKIKAFWLFEQGMAFAEQLGLMPPAPAGGGAGSGSAAKK